jgi:uncharacterized RDD family membrane protein YckC
MESSQPLRVFSHLEATGSHPDLIYDGLRVHLQPAPFWTRTLALAADYGILSIATMVAMLLGAFLVFSGALSLSYVMETLGLHDQTVGAAFMIIFLLVFLLGMMLLTHGYFVFFEYKKNGQTPGKKIFGLKVVTIDGSPLSLGQCLLRETLRYVDIMLVLPGLLAFLLTQKHQRLGDLLAGTMVSYSHHEAREHEYLYVKQSDYLYLREILTPLPVPSTTMRDFLQFVYQAFICSNLPVHQQPYVEKWERIARQYVPQSTEKGLDQLTTLLFFAEYCQQTINHDRQ